MNASTAPRASTWSDQLKAELASLCDLDGGFVDELLDLVTDASCWLLGPEEGTSLIRIPPGPALGDRRAAFLKLAPRASCWLEQGTVLVLSGGYQRRDGATVKAGDRAACHLRAEVVTALEGGDCICCVVSSAR